MSWKCHGWLQARIIKYEFRTIDILSIESSWNISKELPEIFLQHFTTFSTFNCTIFPKQLHTVRKKLPKKQGQKMAPMAPEHLGSMVLLQSWPLPLAQRAHAPGKIHNFQRSEVCGGGCSLKKAMWAKAWVGKCCVVFLVCFCLNARLSILLAIISFYQRFAYLISDDCDKWCLMMVAFILTWKFWSRIQSDEAARTFLPAVKPSATTARNFAVEAPFVPFGC